MIDINVLKEYAETHTMNEICTRFDRCKSTISKKLKKYSIKYVQSKPSGRPREDYPFLDDLINDYKTNKNLKELAEKYSRTRDNIKYLLIRENVYKK